jgi:hypothetical protein
MKVITPAGAEIAKVNGSPAKYAIWNMLSSAYSRLVKLAIGCWPGGEAKRENRE